MVTSYINLFESLQIEIEGPDGRSPLNMRSQKLRTMFAYLIIHRGSPIERDRLGQTLWPQSGEAAARRNLREYLYRIRQLFADLMPDEDVFTTDERFVQFTSPPTCRIDIETFATLINQAETAVSPQQSIPFLQEAVALYQGDLLANIYDDWVQEARERHRKLYVYALHRLTNAWETANNLSKAIQVTHQLLAIDPLEEATHRQLMQLYMAVGDRARALQQFETCSRILQEKLSLSPLPETEALYQAILAGSYGAKEKKTAVSLYTPPSSHRPSFTPFVGRQSEIGRLTAVFEQCRSGRFQSIIITGNSGLGKTRLVNEWLHQLSTNVIVLRGQGHEFEQTIPYRPLLDALQQSLHLIPWAQLPPDSSYAWLAPLAQLLPDLYYHLPNLAATSALTDNETSHHIMEGIIQILAGLARQNKVILFLDDLHWVDMPTWHFLHFLSRRIRQLPLMLIGTFSLPEAGQENKNQLRQLKINGPSQIISLSRLWPADISDLLRQILNQRGQELTHLAHKLHQMSNGNPFYVTELIRALQNSQPSGPYNPAQFDQITLPTAIQTLIENRLDRLDQEHLNMLSIAAAIGREFTYDLLYAITQAEANHLLTQLEDWLDRGLIVERAEGNYDFSHLQIREVVYQRLSRPRRQRIHFQIATAMEQVASSQVEQIAYHYRHSHQPANAIPGLLAAGRRALNTRAYGEARAIGQTLLDISSHAPESATHHNELELNLLLAIASAFTGSTEEALHRLTHASHLAASLDDAAQGSEIALQFAQIHWIRGDAPAARLHAERAMALTQAAPNPVRETAVLRLLGRIAVSQGYYAIAVHYLNKSLEYDTNELNRANTQGYLATAYGHLGQKEPAVLALKEAQRMATQLESPALLAVIQVKAAVAYNALNMLSAAKPLAEQGLATCQAHNMQVYAFIARCVAGRIAHFYCGETAVAYQHLQEAINWAQEENYILFRYLAHLTLAEIAHDTGDQTTLTAQSQIALDLAHRTGNRWVKEQIQRF